MGTPNPREDVLVVMNEREPRKAELSRSLVEQLTNRRLGVERLKPCPSLAEVIIARNPRVLVLDYLLGDEGTALDILTHFQQFGMTDIETAIWTDERSTPVAVQAMKLGAIDYIETESPKSLERVIESIERVLSARQDDGAITLRALPSTIKPIAEAPLSRAALLDGSRALIQRPRLLVLSGPQGAGRNTFARYFHSLRERSGSYIELDLDLWTGNYPALVGPDSRTPLLSFGASVFIDHAEFDLGGLPDAVAAAADGIWPETSDDASPLLMIGTSDETVVEVWSRLFDAPVIRIPGVADRREDMLPLVTSILHELKKSGIPISVQVTPALIEELLRHEWTGNVRELRAVLLDLVSNRAVSESSRTGRNSDEKSGTIEELLCSAIERWDRHSRAHPIVPEPLVARQAYERSGGNVRVAAAMLGTGIPQVRSALGLTLASRSRQSGVGGEPR